ncbi:MAG: hypothetical protein U0837_18255 [Dehalococcoidia bacterium]
MNRLAEKEYPESGVLRQVHGVGDHSAVTYIHLEEKGRFKKSCRAGAYLGLHHGNRHRGEQNPLLGITHAGDCYSACTSSSNAPTGSCAGLTATCADFGERLTARGGKNQKKRAIIAVARKLAVLLHHLWVSAYELPV